MYLDKLNNSWRTYRKERGWEDELVITNTAKLQGAAGMYLLEFAYQHKRYHLYHVLGGTSYELHDLDEHYAPVSFEHVFGISTEAANERLTLVNDFMQHFGYASIQTSVACPAGLEAAKMSIRKIRWNG